MHRRRLLRTAAAGGLATSAGCLGVLSDGTPNTVLGAPDLDVTLEQHRARRYPVWGERLPEVSLPAVPSEERVRVPDLERPALLTYFFSHCRNLCPLLVSGLVGVQSDAVENGYADEVDFLAVTFDPARDDADRLRTYADRMAVSDAGRWLWLRPASAARAREVVDEQFGITYERREREGEGYAFVHPGVVTLANADGYVERAYSVGTKTPPPVQTMIADLERVRTA